MAKINRRYIDKHWLVHIFRGTLSGLFGLLILFNYFMDEQSIVLPLAIFLLAMGAIDAVSAIYNSARKHGWFNCVADAVVDVVAALLLVFLGRENIVASVVILSIYTIVSGLIDIIHGFLSTVDPTDKFIRILTGVFGCIVGLVILNAGDLEVTAFFRFFGTYMIVEGVTSLIYGVHNRAQKIEDREARQEGAHHKEEKSHRTSKSKKS